ncbi:MAG: hypothetical protein J6M39_06720 [Lachnospiraceae bacterium]|nr:hypothetical protein [Lachnospiraceae bacterium]
MAKENLAAKVNDETAAKLNKIAKENPKEEEPEKQLDRINRPRYRNPRNVVEAFEHYPVHIVKLVNLIKSNSDIRRYTSLGIINYLSQKGIIEQAKGYVNFNWTKFSVTNNGLKVEYRYTEPFFINCLIASFTSFANAAQKTIGVFCSNEFDAPFSEDKEMINNAVDAAENADKTAETEE